MRRLGKRWWEAAVLAALGITLVAASWPDTSFLTRIIAVMLLLPLVDHGVARAARIARLSPSWQRWAAEWGPLALCFAVLAGLEQRSVRWGFVALLVTLGIYAALQVASTALRRRWDDRGFSPTTLSSIASVLALGLLIGYVFALPESREVNDGIAFVWRRGLLSAGLTWILGAATVLWARKARPSA